TFEYDSENEACFPTPMLATSNETCAGDNRNCLETPSKELIDIQNEDRFITKVNSDNFVQSYTLPKTIGSPHDTGTNLMVANFTKYCTGVSPAIQDVTGLDLSKFDQFTSPSSSEPAGFSFNITGGEVSTMSPLGGSRAQPLYRVRCLDRSHNIKAEIRFVIR